MTEDWRKSSYSGYNGDCVEVRIVNGRVQVRDSKDRSGPMLTFTPGGWAKFVAARCRGMN